MEYPLPVHAYDCDKNKFYPAVLNRNDSGFTLEPAGENRSAYYLSPGWIDTHAHVYTNGGLGVDCDTIAGIGRGVHLVVDAGSAGADTFQDFLARDIRCSRTRIKAFLHINAQGISRRLSEGHELERMDPVRTAGMIDRFRDYLIGVKVRVEYPIVLDAGIKPLVLALQAAEICRLPVNIHIGCQPPAIDDILPLLRRGDIISHAFHAKGDAPWLADGRPNPALAAAIGRGVRLDLGHGRTAFSADVFQRAIQHPLPPFTVSSDLHTVSYPDPVASLADVMTKVWTLGLALADTIRAVTVSAAQTAAEPDWCGGWAARGQRATLFELADNKSRRVLHDSLGRELIPDQFIVPRGVFVDGQFQPVGDPASANQADGDAIDLNEAADKR